MPTAVLSRHALVIAAIFIPYMATMLILGAYIYRTGKPRSTDRDRDEPGSDEEDDRDLPLAA